MPPILEMLGITKRFPGVVANHEICLSVEEGSIHAIIGENGAGKSTLMNILYGRYAPDSGRILLDGYEVKIGTPAEAIRLGIGLVTQHTTLIPALTLLENCILGAEPTVGGVILKEEAERKVRSACDQLGLELDLHSTAAATSVAGLQKAEIAKALYRGARILILDEPTATLAPQEAESLYEVARSLADGGATVLIITHKLGEVMAHSDTVTVLRAGRSVGTRNTTETDPDELVSLMIGRRAEVPVRRESHGGNATADDPPLRVENLSVRNKRGAQVLKCVSLNVMPGEILGVAGVDGSGQRELAEAVIGMRQAESGRIWIGSTDMTRTSTRERMRSGVAYVPEDRHRDGLVLEFSVAENLLLGHHRNRAFGGGRLLDLRRIESLGRETLHSARVRAAGPTAAASTLSGGNQQKLVIARALRSRPNLLVAMQPTRGLDVAAARHVYDQINQEILRGMGVLLFSLDLDEVLEVSDRIAVLHNGQLAGVVSRAEATAELIGKLMLEGAP